MTMSKEIERAKGRIEKAIQLCLEASKLMRVVGEGRSRKTKAKTKSAPRRAKTARAPAAKSSATPEVRAAILDALRSGPWAASVVAKEKGIAIGQVLYSLRKLVGEGYVVRIGKNKHAVYALQGAA
jgi:predicted Rossmann fold nucleotide-binding protein DprA/Smf involved in DNA uptake